MVLCLFERQRAVSEFAIQTLEGSRHVVKLIVRLNGNLYVLSTGRQLSHGGVPIPTQSRYTAGAVMRGRKHGWTT